MLGRTDWPSLLQLSHVLFSSAFRPTIDCLLIFFHHPLLFPHNIVSHLIPKCQSSRILLRIFSSTVPNCSRGALAPAQLPPPFHPPNNASIHPHSTKVPQITSSTMMDFQKSSPYPMYYPRHPPRSTGVAPVAPPDPQIAPPPLPTTSYATVTTAITTPPTPTAPTAPTAAQEMYILQTTAFPPRDEIPRSTMVYRYPPPPSPAVTIASTPYPPEKAYASARTEHHQRYHVTPTSRSSTKQPPERAYPAHPSSEGWREG
jgi:hypothetical protein